MAAREKKDCALLCALESLQVIQPDKGKTDLCANEAFPHSKGLDGSAVSKRKSSWYCRYAVILEPDDVSAEASSQPNGRERLGIGLSSSMFLVVLGKYSSI